MPKNRRYIIVFLIGIFLLIPTPEMLSQCAMCKQAAESSLKSNAGSIARGLNPGILYLMAVPYLAIVFIFRKQLYQLGKRLIARFSKTPTA